MRSENYSLANLRGVSPDFLMNKLKSTSPNEKMMLSSKAIKGRNNSHSKTVIKAGKMKTINSIEDEDYKQDQAQKTMT